jgi:protein-disulfide isomerase
MTPPGPGLLTPRREPGARITERHPKATLALAVAAGLLASQLLLGRAEPSRQVVTSPSVVSTILGDPGTPRFGPSTATTTVVVFTDYQCPICRRTAPALERLAKADPEVAVVIKDWPILGPGSRLAARAALAAHRQGKYLALHRALMETRRPLTEANLPIIAREAGVDWNRLAADLARHGPEIDATLDRHARQAWSLGLQGTPAYLVGPLLIRGGLDDRALARAVAEARALD